MQQSRPACLVLAAAVWALLPAGCARSTPDRVAVGASAPDRLARTLSILRTSTPEHPQVLRVLFYGQSITSRRWTDLAAAHLRVTYPNTRFVIANMAIGGFAAQVLQRTAARDLADFYPDLVVFHVYGDHRAYENIIRTIRSRTAAEVIVETDHVTEPVEPLCPEGIHLTLTPPPGCKGFLRYRQHLWEEHMSGVVIPALAEQYGLAVEPRRRIWNAYLQSHHIARGTMIADPPHPNERGWRLMAGIFEHWFDAVARTWSGQRSTLAVDLPAPAPGMTRSYAFDGNRVELIGSGPFDGRVTATVDGRLPMAIDGCWQTTRATPLTGVPDWPAIRQVTVAPSLHRAERWTATVTKLNAAQDRFRFALKSDRSGPDGEGQADQDFTSPSGDIRIAAQDWTLADAVRDKHQRVAEGFRTSWSHGFVCKDQPAIPLGGGAAQVRHVIATDLPNGRHRLVVRLSPGTSASMLRVYRPPLADDAA